MLGIMIVAGGMAWILLILWLVLEGGPRLNVVAFVVFVVPAGIMIDQAIKLKRENPCVEWERKNEL
jgi:hypothetical protein